MQLVTRLDAQAGPGEVCTGSHASAGTPAKPDYCVILRVWDRAVRVLAALFECLCVKAGLGRTLLLIGIPLR